MKRGLMLRDMVRPRLYQRARHYESHGLAQPVSAVTLHFGDRDGRLAIPKLREQVARDPDGLVRGCAKTGALRVAENLGAESHALSLAALTHMVRRQSKIQGVFQLHRCVAPPG